MRGATGPRVPPIGFPTIDLGLPFVGTFSQLATEYRPEILTVKSTVFQAANRPIHSNAAIGARPIRPYIVTLIAWQP